MRDLKKFFTVFVALIFISKMLIAYPQQELEAESVTEIKEINFQIVDEDKIEFTIEVEGEFYHEIFGLSDPLRLVVDLFPIQKISVGPYVDIGSIGVLRIRVGQFQPQVARVVFDLAERVPNYRVTSAEGKLKVAFWFEEVIEKKEEPLEVEVVEVKPEKIPEEVPEEAPKEIPQIVVQEIIPKVPRILEHNYFIQLKTGVGIPISPKFESQSSFTLYGEQGDLNENYKIKTNVIFDLSAGKFFMIKDIIIKGTLNLSYWTFANGGSFQTSLPHPIVPNDPRDYTFDESMRGTMFGFSVTPLFSIFGKKKWEVWLGPILGFSTGKLEVLEDIDLEERSPYTSSDITVTAKALLEEKLNSLMLGVAGNLEYKIGRNLSLVLDTKFIYLNPKSKTLDVNTNLSQLQLAIGVLYYFY